MRGGSSKRVTGAAVLCLALAACGATMPGVEDKPPAAKFEMTGRWLLTAANAPACGMTFGISAEPESGGIKPEGGCPGDFFTSRHWRLQHDDLLISNHNDEPLAQLRFVGGRFEGKSTGGMQVTLARSVLPAN
jgi:protease inhibitor Inh